MPASISEGRKRKTSSSITAVLTVLILGVGCDVFAPGWDKTRAMHWYASWSPSTEWIAFYDSVDRYLSLVDTTGLKLHKILSMEAPHFSYPTGITWSPDGRWIAFSSEGDLYKITAEGDSIARLTGNGGNRYPSWSGDGKFIAFAHRDSIPGEDQIWVLDVNNGETTNLAEYGQSPSWHPNNQLVVFHQNPDMDYCLICTVDVETGTIDTLTTFRTHSGLYFNKSSIDPMGEEVVFDVSPIDGPINIFKIDLPSGDFTWLTSGGGSYPAWSPGGNRIIYTYYWDGNGGLWIMNSDGSGKRMLTDP